MRLRVLRRLKLPGLIHEVGVDRFGISLSQHIVPTRHPFCLIGATQHDLIKEPVHFRRQATQVGQQRTAEGVAAPAIAVIEQLSLGNARRRPFSGAAAVANLSRAAAWG